VGTSLFSWDNTKSSRPGVVKAAVGAHTTKDYVVTASREGAPPISLDVHVEVATIDFEEAGHPVHQTSPVVITAKVKDNTGWELSGKCEDGPHYQMPSVSADGGLDTPLGMRQDCNISEHRVAGAVFKSTWGVGFMLDVYGDGKVDPFPSEGITVTAR
jgi:hypothetical protein